MIPYDWEKGKLSGETDWPRVIVRFEYPVELVFGGAPRQLPC